MSTDEENIGARLKRFAIAKYGSVNGLAKDLGTIGGSLRSNYISGKSIPGGKMILMLGVLGCDPMWLLTGTGFPPDMNEQEMERYIEWLQETLKRTSERLELYREAKRQVRRDMEAAGISVDPEPAAYVVKKKKKKGVE